VRFVVEDGDVIHGDGLVHGLMRRRRRVLHHGHGIHGRSRRLAIESPATSMTSKATLMRRQAAASPRSTVAEMAEQRAFSTPH
jgi:hypothetical protein